MRCITSLWFREFEIKRLEKDSVVRYTYRFSQIRDPNKKIKSVCMLSKILFCDNSLRELLNFRGEIIRYYVSRGHKVVLVAPEVPGQPLIDDNQVKYIPVVLNRSGKNPLQDWCYLNSLRRIYKQEKPDYIFHYTIKPNIYGTIAAKICGIRSSAMIAGLGYVFYKPGIGNRIARVLYKYALRFSEHVFVLNLQNKEFLLAQGIVSPKRLIYLQGGEGIDLKSFQPHTDEKIEKEKTIFIWVARLLYDKGYAEYVEAARYIKQKYPEVEFRVLGSIDEAYPNHVPRRIVLRDVDDGIITYLGYCPDVVPQFRPVDCVVLPSFYNEGLSRVLMEATAMGKPVITTDIPGCRETVKNGKNGFIIAPKNTDALINALERFICTDADTRKAMGACSRRLAEEKFDINKVIAIYKGIWG